MSILQYSILNRKKHLLLLLLMGYLSSIDLNAQTANFNYIISKKCAPTLVSFSNNSTTGGGIVYMWDFGKGATVFSDEMELQEVYSESGDYSVTLSVIDGPDTVRSTKVISILEGPKANFSISDSVGCVPKLVSLTDKSVPGDGAIQSYFWDLKNGSTFTEQNPEINFTVADDYSIYFKVTDVNSCSDFVEYSSKLILKEGPVASFTTSEAFSCNPPLRVNFVNTSIGTGVLESNWNFGNGIQSTNLHDTLTYLDYGAYSVSLEVRDEFGCTSKVNKINHVNIGIGSTNVSAFVGGIEYEEDSVLLCPGTVMFISDLSSRASKEWLVNYNGVEQNFGSLDTLELEFVDSGFVQLKLYYGEGTACPDTLIKTYFIDWIEADFELNSYASCSVPVDISTMNNSLNAVSYRWSLPDGVQDISENTSYSISSELTYYQEYNHHINNDRFIFRLVATNGNSCSDTLIKSFTTNLPIARFMPDVTSGCAPLVVTFNDVSQSDEDIESWEYLIDGVKVADSDGAPWQYTFTNAGEYQVEMVIQNNSMCYDTSYAVTIMVGEEITPIFSVTPGEVCQGESVTISNSTVADPDLYAWSYSVANVFHSGEITGLSAILSAKSEFAGAHDVYVTVNYNGCYSSDTLADALKVNGPTGSFVEYINCETPLQYTFVSKMDSANSLIWELDGQTFNNVDTVVYTFPARGDYLVKLTGVQGSTGCVLEKLKLIKVREVDAVIEEVPYVCLGDEVIFVSSNSNDYIDNCYEEGFLWDFGDQLPPRRTYDTSFAHIYEDTGTYAVKLFARAVNGCVDSAKTEIIVASPFPEFTVDNDKGCSPEMTVNFQYSNRNSGISSWEWIYNDGAKEEMGLDVEHVYRSNYTRYYYPALVATDIYGCEGYVSKPIVFTNPNADFRAFDYSVCVGEPVAFYAISPSYDSILFNFGDGSDPSDMLRHEYNERGEYTVSLKVFEDGCSDMLTRSNYIIIDGADANFSITNDEADCYPATFGFNHLSPDINIVDGNWDFGNGSESGYYSQNVQYTYTQPGEYPVSLTTFTVNNCSSTETKTVTVNGPAFDFVFTPNSICSGADVKFSVLDTLNVDAFEWVFGDGATSEEFEPDHTYLAHGDIVPAVSVSNENCNVLIVKDTLQVSNLMADFNLGEKNEFCVFENFSALNTSHNYQTAKWYINNQEISSENDLVYVLMEEGEYAIKLEVSDADLCVDTLTDNIIVWPIPNFEIEGDRYVCAGSQAELFVEQVNADWDMQWIPSDAVSSASNFSVVTAIEESSLIQAEVTNSHECSTTKSVLVNVGDAIDMSSIPVFDTAIYIGEELQIIVSSSGGELEYSWEPNYNISCTHCSSPKVWPRETTSYTLTVSDSCESQVLVFPVEVIIDFYLELPDAFSPNYDDKNDMFVYEHHNVGEVDFQIYNRWGNLVFRSNVVGDGWDGMFQGSLQNVDTYTFYVRAKTIHGYEFERKGTFMLLK